MKVIGIHAIYFASQKPEQLRSWYSKLLGINSHFFGIDIGNQKTFSTKWSPIHATDKMISPDKQFVFAYRVDDLGALVESLKQNNYEVTKLEESSEGNSAYVFDPVGNKVILVQPFNVLPEPASGPAERVTGLGGIFFKATNSKELGAWYAKYLSFDVTEWGCSFQWIDAAKKEAEAPASTAWSIFASTSKYFDPSTKSFMINYRVKNLSDLLTSLKSADVEMVGDPQEFSYGKFGWILDPEGNKIELWEPIDGGF